ncbi:MAG: hypothetical protein ABIK61_04295 [candidate division WOR-3 bacterium]
MKVFDWILRILGVLGIPISWFILKWCPDHPEYAQKILYYLIKLIPFVFSWKKRKLIEKEIQGFVNEEILSINKESFGLGILPKNLKIEWTLKKSKEVIINENEIIIRLGDRLELCENFVDALLLYLDKSFMPESQIYLDPSLYEACKYCVAISMLRKRSDKHYRIFIDKYYKPALEKNKDILKYNEKLESIEKNGLLSSILLSSLAFYSNKWIYERKTPSAEIQDDIEKYIEFIANIANKKEYEESKGELPPLYFTSKHIKVNVVLIARKELAKELSYMPHFEVAKDKLKAGCDIVFVTGRGNINISLAEAVALKLREEQIGKQINGASKFYFYTDDNRKIEGICYAFEKFN